MSHRASDVKKLLAVILAAVAILATHNTHCGTNRIVSPLACIRQGLANQPQPRMKKILGSPCNRTNFTTRCTIYCIYNACSRARETSGEKSSTSPLLAIFALRLATIFTIIATCLATCLAIVSTTLLHIGSILDIYFIGEVPSTPVLHNPSNSSR